MNKNFIALAAVALLASGAALWTSIPSGLQAELADLAATAGQARAYKEEQEKKEQAFRKELREAPLRAAGVQKADLMDLTEVKTRLRTAAVNGGRSVEIYREPVGDDEFWGDSVDFTGYSLMPEIKSVTEAQNSRRAEFAAMTERLKSRLGLRVVFFSPAYSNPNAKEVVIWASW